MLISMDQVLYFRIWACVCACSKHASTNAWIACHYGNFNWLIIINIEEHLLFVQPITQNDCNYIAQNMASYLGQGNELLSNQFIQIPHSMITIAITLDE